MLTTVRRSGCCFGQVCDPKGQRATRQLSEQLQALAVSFSFRLRSLLLKSMMTWWWLRCRKFEQQKMSSKRKKPMELESGPTNRSGPEAEQLEPGCLWEILHKSSEFAWMMLFSSKHFHSFPSISDVQDIWAARRPELYGLLTQNLEASKADSRRRDRNESYLLPSSKSFLASRFSLNLFDFIIWGFSLTNWPVWRKIHPRALGREAGTFGIQAVPAAMMYGPAPEVLPFAGAWDHWCGSGCIHVFDYSQQLTFPFQIMGMC